MIQHIVFYKWKADAPPATIEAAKAACRKLKDIPGVTDFAEGKNISPVLHHDFGYGFSLKVKDKAGLAAYQAHPHHVAVAAICRPNSAEIFVADLDC